MYFIIYVNYIIEDGPVRTRGQRLDDIGAILSGIGYYD